jgi:hypothetical protein
MAVTTLDEWAVLAALYLADGVESGHGNDHEDEDEKDDGCHGRTHDLSPLPSMKPAAPRITAAGRIDQKRWNVHGHELAGD